MLALREPIAAEPIPPRVLVIDDNKDYCALVGHVLNDLGCEVDFAHEPRGATALIKRARPYAVIILDLVFDVGPSGAEVLRAWLSVDPELRVVIVTGYVTPELQKAAASSRVEIVEKSVKPDQLKAILDRALKHEF